MSMASIDEFLATGSRASAQAVVDLGEAAIAPLLRAALRAERAPGRWGYEGRRAAHALYFLPLDDVVAEEMWRLSWSMEADPIFHNAPRAYVGVAGPRMVESLGRVMAEADDWVDALGAVEAMHSAILHHPSLKPYVTEVWRVALEYGDPELVPHVARSAKELGLMDLARDILKSLDQEGVEDEDGDLDEIRAWARRPAPIGRIDEHVYSLRFDTTFPLATGDEPPSHDRRSRWQETFESWAREHPELASGADAFLRYAVQFPQDFGVEIPRKFILEEWPGYAVGDDERLIESLSSFWDAAGERAFAKDAVDARDDFAARCDEKRRFGRSKRIVLAAQRAGIDGQDRDAIIQWFWQKKREPGGEAWVMPSQFRLSDVFLPRDAEVWWKKE